MHLFSCLWVTLLKGKKNSNKFSVTIQRRQLQCDLLCFIWWWPQNQNQKLKLSEYQLTNCSWLQINAGSIHKKKNTFNWFFPSQKHFLRIIIMQINRLISWASIHAEGFLWMEVSSLLPRWFFKKTFHFDWPFSVCSTKEFSSSRPRTLAVLRIWGVNQHSDL